MLSPAFSLTRILFLVAVALGVFLIWQTPYLPMLDLPQHVGQIAALHDLLFATHPFADELRLNFFTPYLLFYLPAALLSMWVAPLVAAKVLLTLSLVGWLWAGRLFLRHFGGEPHLIWLFLPAFFSFCYLAGFLTFLLAAPLVLLVLIRADIYAQKPTWSGLVELTFLLVGLFFCHGLAFYFAYFLTGLLWLSRHHRHPTRLIIYGAPLLIAALPAVVHLYVSLLVDPAISQNEPLIFYTLSDRFLNYLLYQSAFPSPTSVFLVAALLLAPFLLGDIRKASSGAKIIAGGFALLWLTLPYNPAQVSFVFDRYSLYLLPILAILLPAKSVDPRITRITLSILIFCVLSLLAIMVQTQAQFAHKTQSYLKALKDLPQGQRVLGLVAGRELDEMMDITHWYLASWYQSERGGWVEFNFANFEPQIVRYKNKIQPVYNTRMTQLERFNWQAYQAQRFNYIAIWHGTPLTNDFFTGASCTVEPWRAGAGWSIFVVKNCPDESRVAP